MPCHVLSEEEEEAENGKYVLLKLETNNCTYVHTYVVYTKIADQNTASALNEVSTKFGHHHHTTKRPHTTHTRRHETTRPARSSTL